MKAYHATTPDQEGPDGSKNKADHEEGREDGFGSEYRLPCFETLLLEGSVFVGGGGLRRLAMIRIQRVRKDERENILAGLRQLPFSFFPLESRPFSLSSLLPLRKRPIETSVVKL